VSAPGVLLAVAVVAGCGLRLRGVGRPWDDLHLGWGGAFYSTVASNYLARGFWGCRTLPVVRGDRNGRPVYYLHHPPGLGWMLAGCFRAFGRSEAVATAVPVTASVASILILYGLGRRVWGRSGGALGALWMALAPAGAYYGAHVDPQGAVALCVLLAGFYAGWRWIESGRRSALYATCALLVAALWVGWVGVYLVPMVCLLDRAARGRGVWRRCRPLLLTGGAVFVTLAAVYIVSGAWVGAERLHGGGLLQSLGGRSVVGEADERAPSLAVWLASLRRHVRDVYTAPLLLAALAGVFVCLRRRFRDTVRQAGIAALFLPGVAHLAVFPNGAYHHDYWLVFLLPGVAVSAAGSMVAIGRAAGRRGRMALVLLIAGVAACCLSSVQHLHARESFAFATLGSAIAASAPRDAAVLTSAAEEPQVSYYAGRPVRGEIRDSEAFRNALAGMTAGRAVFVQPAGDRLEGDLAARLASCPSAPAGAAGTLFDLGLFPPGREP
jgi:4-amino-4-deoxy-L-arabinose transferase-like glycosyltransferase